MTDFHDKRTVEATRKAYRCMECERRIAKGDRAVARSGRYDGDFYSHHTHVDCDAVSNAYAKQFDMWGEDTVQLHQLFEVDELLWLIGEHSEVAERMKAEQRLADREQFWRDFSRENAAQPPLK